jgi:hypothetical protein
MGTKATGIRRVWASPFSERAYLERREFNIQEEVVGKAILMMPRLRKNVRINGVAVRSNPFRPDLSENLLNAQIGTTAMTESCGGAIPEQVLIMYDEGSDLCMQYIGEFVGGRRRAFHNTGNCKEIRILQK